MRAKLERTHTKPWKCSSTLEFHKYKERRVLKEMEKDKPLFDSEHQRSIGENYTKKRRFLPTIKWKNMRNEMRRRKRVHRHRKKYSLGMSSKCSESNIIVSSKLQITTNRMVLKLYVPMPSLRIYIRSIHIFLMGGGHIGDNYQNSVLKWFLDCCI